MCVCVVCVLCVVCVWVCGVCVVCGVCGCVLCMCGCGVCVWVCGVCVCVCIVCLYIKKQHILTMRDGQNLFMLSHTRFFFLARVSATFYFPSTCSTIRPSSGWIFNYFKNVNQSRYGSGVPQIFTGIQGSQIS